MPTDKRLVRLVLGLAACRLAPKLSRRYAGTTVPGAYYHHMTALLSLLACVYVAFQTRRRGRQQLTAEHEQVMQSLHAYRIALERRRNHYSTAWRWSMCPITPGVIVILGGGVLFDERPHKRLHLSLAAQVCAVAFLVGAWFAFRKGEGFHRELDALKSLDEGAP